MSADAVELQHKVELIGWHGVILGQGGSDKQIQWHSAMPKLVVHQWRACIWLSGARVAGVNIVPGSMQLSTARKSINTGHSIALKLSI